MQSGILLHLVPVLTPGAADAATQMTNVLKNLAMAGGLGYISVFGTDSFSLDARRGRAGRVPHA